jgi:hypothetical protein
MPMDIRILKTTYPCCGGPAIIDAMTLLPRETYNKKCPRCKTGYQVERTAITTTFGWIDTLEWLDKATNLYTHIYGVPYRAN